MRQDVPAQRGLGSVLPHCVLPLGVLAAVCLNYRASALTCSCIPMLTNPMTACLMVKCVGKQTKKDLYIQNFYLLWPALSGECSVVICCTLTWVTSCPSPQNIVISEGIMHMCSCHRFVQLLQGLQSTCAPAFQSFRGVLPDGVDHLLVCLLYILANDLAKMSKQFRKIPVIWIELKPREGILLH